MPPLMVFPLMQVLGVAGAEGEGLRRARRTCGPEIALGHHQTGRYDYSSTLSIDAPGHKLCSRGRLLLMMLW